MFETLDKATSEWNGLLRASGVQSIRGLDREDVLHTLFHRFVEVPAPMSVVFAESPPSPYGQFTSRQAVRSVRIRIERFGLKAKRDYFEDAQVRGLTKGEIPVPVWYPLQIGRLTLVDALEIKDDAHRDFDAARLTAQKVEQTLRAEPNRLVSIFIKDPAATGLGEQVEQIIASDGRIDGARARLHRYVSAEHLDDVVKELVSPPTLL